MIGLSKSDLILPKLRLVKIYSASKSLLVLFNHYLFLQLLMRENLDLKLTPYNVLATSIVQGKFIYLFIFVVCASMINLFLKLY